MNAMNVRSLAAEVKSFDDAGSGGWEAIASTISVDRDGEVVAARCFEPLPTKVPVRLGHNGGPLVGSGRPFYSSGNELRISGRFASTAPGQEARTLAREGHLTDMSVVFLPITDKQVDGRRHITGAELLAVDFVEIASNRDAHLVSVRGFQPGARLTEAERWRLRLAALEAELLLLDAEKGIKASPVRPAEPVDIHAALADAKAFLAELAAPARPAKPEVKAAPQTFHRNLFDVWNANRKDR
jgi:hypothetical protein